MSLFSQENFVPLWTFSLKDLSASNQHQRSKNENEYLRLRQSITPGHVFVCVCVCVCVSVCMCVYTHTRTITYYLKTNTHALSLLDGVWCCVRDVYAHIKSTSTHGWGAWRRRVSTYCGCLCVQKKIYNRGCVADIRKKKIQWKMRGWYFEKSIRYDTLKKVSCAQALRDECVLLL